jgi:hypothetical protein
MLDTDLEIAEPIIVDENSAALVLCYGQEHRYKTPGIVLPLAHACIEEQDYLAIAEELGIMDLVEKDLIQKHDFYDIGLYNLERNKDGTIKDVAGFMHRLSAMIAEKAQRPVYVVASKHSRIKGDPNRRPARLYEAIYTEEAKAELAKKVDFAEGMSTHWLFWGMVDRWQEIADCTTRIDVHTMTDWMNGKMRPAACVITSDKEYGAAILRLFQNPKYLPEELKDLPLTLLGEPYDITKPGLLARNMPGINRAANLEIRNDLTNQKAIQEWYANALAAGIKEGLFDRRSRIDKWLSFRMTAHKILWASNAPDTFSIWPVKDHLARALPKQLGTSPAHNLAAIKVFLDLMVAEGRYVKQAPGNQEKAAFLEDIHLKPPREIGFLFEREQMAWLRQHGLHVQPSQSHPEQGIPVSELVASLKRTVVVEKTIYDANIADTTIIQPTIAHLADGRVILLLGEAEMPQPNNTSIRYVASYDPAEDSWAYYRKDNLPLLQHLSEPSLYVLKGGSLPLERLYAAPAASVSSLKRNLSLSRFTKHNFHRVGKLLTHRAHLKQTVKPIVISTNENQHLGFKRSPRPWKHTTLTMASLKILRPTIKIAQHAKRRMRYGRAAPKKADMI